MICDTISHYWIIQKIGAGGMGEVYRAHDDQLRRDVAIKILNAKFSADAHAKINLLREAQSASALNDPHICTIYEIGEINGHAFIVMEFIEGRPLREVIPSGGLPPALVARYGTQISAALIMALIRRRARHRAAALHAFRIGRHCRQAVCKLQKQQSACCQH